MKKIFLNVKSKIENCLFDIVFYMILGVIFGVISVAILAATFGAIHAVIVAAIYAVILAATFGAIHAVIVAAIFLFYFAISIIFTWQSIALAKGSPEFIMPIWVISLIGFAGIVVITGFLERHRRKLKSQVKIDD